MKLDIPVGTVFRKEIIVKPQHLASKFGSGRVDVLSTPYLVALIEATCSEGLQPYHSNEFASVGAVVNVKHLRPTPLGMSVRCEAIYQGIDEKGLYCFDAKVYDEVELVSVCQHKRGLINVKQFMEKTMNKQKEL